ncbi:MAG: 2OG-Fe(II) oxygenase [Myxococcota bacterium]
MQPKYSLQALEGSLTVAECAEWIACLEARGFTSMANRYPPGYRNNHRAILDSPELADSLFRRLRPQLPEHWRDRDGTDWRLTGLNARFRACRYQPGQSFCVHRDGAQADAETRTFRTLMLYLNDASEFDGGATRFYGTRDGTGPVHTVVPSAGLALVFPHDVWHDGEEIRSGRKYVLRTDLVYERVAPRSARAGHRGYVWDAAATADGWVSVGRDGLVVEWAPRSDQPIRTMAIPGAGLTAVAVLSDGTTLAGDRRGRIFEVSDSPRPFAEVRGAVLAMRRFADGVLIADATGRITALGGGSPATWHADVCADGRRPWLFGLATDGERVWVGDGARVTTLRWKARPRVVARRAMAAPVRAIAARDDGTLAVGLHDGCVLRVGDRVVELGRHEGAVRSVAWLEGDRIASGGEDDRLRVWSPHEEALTLPHDDFVTRVLVTAGGHLVSTSYDETVRRWDQVAQAPTASRHSAGAPSG